MKRNYQELADVLVNANFQIYGLGNFDLTHDEIALILEILFSKVGEKRISSLRGLYARLEQERLG